MPLDETDLRLLMIDGLAGDAQSYRRLLDHLSRYLRGYFLRRLGNDKSADAEDLVQETLAGLHQKRATYDPGQPFTAWVHAIARYKMIDHFRRRKIRIHLPIDDVTEACSSRTAARRRWRGSTSSGCWTGCRPIPARS